MYHSHLLINVGEDPDRPDWDLCRRWLRNLYRVHQRLCMAFPSAPVASGDRAEASCRPFAANNLAHLRNLPVEGSGGDVHQARCEGAGFLFRVDYPVRADYPQQAGPREPRGTRPVILVQSAAEPDWDYAFGLIEGAKDDRGRPIGNAGFLLAAPPQHRQVAYEGEGDALHLRCPRSPEQDCSVYSGQLVRFRLHANPTVKRDGRRKRVEPTFPAHAEWLVRKLGSASRVLCIESFVPGWAHGWQGKHEPQDKHEPQGRRPMQWWSVLFEGSFRVGDTTELKRLLESGIGSAKAFGFGLLSVAPTG